MRIFKPMLFIGIGGTGCRIGAELERRLRHEWCGPTGVELAAAMPAEGLSPFELPRCTQFVYVDLSEDELREAAPANIPRGVWSQTASRLTFQLSVDGYVMAADKLRLLGDIVDWLPGPGGEPRVAPFSKGAGQMPTAGRAALFLAMESNGLAAFANPITEAVGRIVTSGAHLAHLAGGNPMEETEYVDVFVAFSVAGGTGCGMFYDILHLVSDALERAHLNYNLFPLTLMPSAFQLTKGVDLERAKLNGGPAIIDLGRFIDQQNAPWGEDVAVTYPDRSRISIPAARAQTVMLFSGAAGVHSEDLHRGIASFVLSLVGTEVAAPAGDGVGAAVVRFSQSFADDFINRGNMRSSASQTGVGRRGVSTAVAASLTIPREQIATIVAGELLGQAIQLYLRRAPGESNVELVKGFVAAAGLEALAKQEALLPAPEMDASVEGEPQLVQKLRERGEAMKQNLKTMRRRLDLECAGLAAFDWVGASAALLGSGADPFRLLRVVEGNPGASAAPDKAGFVGLLLARSQVPADAPKSEPPPLPEFKKKVFRKVTVATPGAAQAIEDQNTWYDARVKVTWAQAWGGASPQWSDTRAKCLSSLRRFREQFGAFGSRSKTAFTDGCNSLYAPRTGSSYFLPPPGPSNALAPFYQQVLHRLRLAFGLRGDANEAEIVKVILGPTGWSEAFARFHERPGEDAAVQYVLGELTNATKDAMSRGGDGVTDPAILPNLAELLQAHHAKARGQTPTVTPQLLAQFTTALANLKPMGFQPQGDQATLRTLVSYPGNLTPQDAQQALHSILQLGNPQFVQYRQAASDALVVTMLKLDMGVMDVDEPRALLTFWGDRSRRPATGDYLPWRRRLADDGWLLTTPDSRREIVFRLLNVLWDGLVDIEGKLASPTRVSIRNPRNPDARRIVLRLEEAYMLSSWGSFVEAYERFVLAGDPIDHGACSAFMEYEPENLTNGGNPPSDTYRAFRALAVSAEKRILDVQTTLPDKGRQQAERIRRFWATTVEGAIDTGFAGAGMVDNHRSMYAHHAQPERP